MILFDSQLHYKLIGILNKTFADYLLASFGLFNHNAMSIEILLIIKFMCLFIGVLRLVVSSIHILKEIN